MMHLMDLDVGQVDFNAKDLGVDIFYMKEGKREEFEEQVKRDGRVGGWYVLYMWYVSDMVLQTYECIHNASATLISPEVFRLLSEEPNIKKQA